MVVGKSLKSCEKENLRAIQPPKFIPRTTDSKHGKRVCQNLLPDQPKPSQAKRSLGGRRSGVRYYVHAFKGWKMGLYVYLDGLIFQANRRLAISRQYGRKSCQGTLDKGTFKAESKIGHDRALGPWRSIFIAKNEESDQNF
ncbi:hypothetical protein [Dyadobacter koreensis]|uniref:hypothetical protein n=1 Tax=Dyadobacter koreensis TaxID=408657 RepID=UPI000AE9A5DF|nr:hypothetical protein [Dyadobacter koreensis]